MAYSELNLTNNPFSVFRYPFLEFEVLNGVLVELVEDVDNVSLLDLSTVSVVELSIVLALDTGSVGTGSVAVEHEVTVEGVTGNRAGVGVVGDQTSVRSWAGAGSLGVDDPSADALEASWRSVGVDSGPLALRVTGGVGAPSVSVRIVTVLANGAVGDSVPVGGADAVGWDVASAEASSGVVAESVAELGLAPGAVSDAWSVEDVAVVEGQASAVTVSEEVSLVASGTGAETSAGHAAVAAACEGGAGEEGDSDELDEFVHL